MEARFKVGDKVHLYGIPHYHGTIVSRSHDEWGRWDYEVMWPDAPNLRGINPLNYHEVILRPVPVPTYNLPDELFEVT